MSTSEIRNEIYSRMDFFFPVVLKGAKTYCEDCDCPSWTFTKQLIQLLFRNGVHDKTDDEEERQENAQNATQKCMEAHTSVVSHISPVRSTKRGLINISGASTILQKLTQHWTPDWLWFIRSLAKRPHWPVLVQSAVDAGANEVTVFLQLIQSLLNSLVDGLLDRLTNAVDLVHTSTRLKTKAIDCIESKKTKYGYFNKQTCLLCRNWGCTC